MLLELTRPFSYLQITHPGYGIRVVNWVLPGGLSSVVVVLCVLFSVPIDVFGSAGFLSKVLGFVQSLPGFYIAALAAISTFNNSDMDKLMPGRPPEAKIIYNGHLQSVPLTRRRMLSMLFSFLTAESLVLTLCAIGAMTLAQPIKDLMPEYLLGGFKVAFSFLYLTFLMQMFIVTMWGLYYLGERIHTPDPSIDGQ